MATSRTFGTAGGLTAKASSAQSSADLLSSVGAGIAGIGLGALLASTIAEFALLVLAVGLAAHLTGMVVTHQRQAAEGYRPALWEQAAYWGCWLAIAGLIVFGITRYAI